MTSRSFDSLASERRRAIVRDDDVVNYVLRVAYLSYLLTPRPSISTYSSDIEDREREYRSRMSAAISSSISSIGDLFKDVGRDGPRPVKFPEKFIKVLDQKMQNIAMGKDPGYTDQLIRRTIAVFWGAFKEQSFHRQIKENRKIEELILMFVTTSTAALKKDPQLAGDTWKLELNNQISQFIRMLRECLRNVSHVQPELTARLEMYAAKFIPQPSPDSGDEPAPANPLALTVNYSVHDMHLVRSVGRLFEISDSDLQKEVNALRKFCSERTCLNNINSSLPFPGRREDFENDIAFNHWKTTEQTHLSQLMVIMFQFKPDLANPAPSETSLTPSEQRPESLYSLGRSPDSPLSRSPSISSRYSISGTIPAEVAGDSLFSHTEALVGHTFTYIPPVPKKYYKRLLERCIDYDLKSMEALAEDQEVSLGILSVKNLEILNECALRWRIMHSYRVSCFLDVIKYRYEREKVPLVCIPEALSILQRAVQDSGFDNWPRQDTDYLATVCSSVFNLFLSSLYHALESLPSPKPEEIQPIISILQQVEEIGLLERFQGDVVARLKDLSERVQVIAVHQYTEKSNDLFANPTPNRAMPLLLLTDILERHAKLLDKHFPHPVLGRLDFVSLYLDTQIPLFLTDLEHSRRILLETSVKQPSPDIPIEDIFTLFRRTKVLLKMHSAFCPSSIPDFDLPGFFEPYVKHWLLTTDNRTGQWVHAAISVDKFTAEGPEGHSSSIIDLFDSLRSPINFLLDLEWPAPYQEARFFTSLSRTISKSLEQYCRSVEELFMTEMFPRGVEPSSQPQKQSATFFMEKAKLSLQGEKKVDPFNFTPASCVKLNNIEAARKLLDNMYQQMHVDKFSETLQAHGPPVPEKQEKPRFLFTVKIVMAEGLAHFGNGTPSKLDTFVTLSNEHGARFAKTRTIYETSEPRWNETFDISVEGTLWLMASVRDRQLIGKHDTIARAYLCLDPRRYGDFLTHDEWLDFDTSGRILLRISMEGEQDDPRFYFGRAFRSLKRAEGDMVRVIIDKMTPFVRQSLSLNVLKTLTKSGNLGIDYSKALGNFTSVYKSYVGSNASEIHIPLPQQEKARLKPEVGLTDSEIEDSIAPLLGYLDSNMQVLNSSLTDTAKEMVLTRLWKEILNVIESLLVPPLSDSPSNMKPLSDKSVDIVFQWLKILLHFFYVDGEGPMSIESLQNQKFRDVMSIRLYYDWHSDALMEESVRALQTALRSAPTMKKRAKSVYHQRNLGTIKVRKKEKAKAKEATNGEMILRILRMRPHTSEFIGQQLSIMNQIQTEQEQRSVNEQIRRVQGQDKTPIPPVPSMS